jgi:hypothetical protein
MNDHRVGFRADELNSAYDPVFGDIIGTPVEGQDKMIRPSAVWSG